MLLSEKEDLIVSTLGWVDAGGLWICETRSGEAATHRISDARYLSLHPGTGGHFSVMHHHDGAFVRITAHSFDDPARTIAGVTFKGDGHDFEGDSAVWAFLQKAYVAYLKRPANSDYHLFLIDPLSPGAGMMPCDWYDSSYDKGYQGVIGAVDVPVEEKVIISIQRDSHPVLYDTALKKVVKKLSLAGRHGNPTLRFNRKTGDLWADDYDTILRLDPGDFSVKNKRLMQWGNQFMGAFAFNRDESKCLVARPFSGDALALDTKSFKVTHSCKLGLQPLQVAMLSDGTVYGRDWKTGTILKGRLKRKWIAL